MLPVRIHRILTLAVLGCAMLFGATAQSAPPSTLHYQGYLTNASGNPINSAMTAVRFNIYNGAGTELYSETVVVPVTNGQFSATIGNQVALTLPFDQPYSLGIKVAGDPEMTPRQPIAAAAYAHRARIADQLDRSVLHSTGDFNNVFLGFNAANFSVTGFDNTAVGSSALQALTGGILNAAFGVRALDSNTTGSQNIAFGPNALSAVTTGGRNIGIGSSGGGNLTTGSLNIAIGNQGVAGESNTIRIGTAADHSRSFIAGVHNVSVPSSRDVVIDSNGQLGTSTVQRGETSVGTGMAGVNTYTVTFPTAFAVAPKVIVTPKLDLDVSDTFAVTIRSISTTQFRVNVYRVDVAGNSWGANLRLEWQAWN